MRRRALLATAASVGMAGCASRLRGLLGGATSDRQGTTPAETTLPPISETATPSPTKTPTERSTSGPRPKFEVTEIRLPDRIRPYQQFHVTVGVRNRSEVAGLFWTQFVVLDNTGVVDTRTLTVTVDANSIAFTELGPFMFRSYGRREVRTVDGGGRGQIEVTPVEYGFGETHIGSRFEITIDRTGIESTLIIDETEYQAAAGWRFLLTSITVQNVYESTPPGIDAFGVMAGDVTQPGRTTLTHLADGSTLNQGRIDQPGQPYTTMTAEEQPEDTVTSGWAVFEVPTDVAETAVIGYNRRPNVAYVVRWFDTAST